MKVKILKGTGETNSKKLIDVLLRWQFNAEIRSIFQMLQSTKGCWYTFSQYCRNDSYSKWFLGVQILVQISDDCVDVG